jgi:hypothetical protein
VVYLPVVFVERNTAVHTKIVLACADTSSFLFGKPNSTRWCQCPLAGTDSQRVPVVEIHQTQPSTGNTTAHALYDSEREILLSVFSLCRFVQGSYLQLSRKLAIARKHLTKANHMPA